MRYRITAPVAGATCTVAGVAFDNSVGETDNPGAVAYFERHGYQVDAIEDAPVAKPEARSDPSAQPKKSDSTAAWRTWAAGFGGMTQEQAAAMSRDQLAEHFEKKPEAGS